MLFGNEEHLVLVKLGYFFAFFMRKDSFAVIKMGFNSSNFLISHRKERIELATQAT